MDTRIESDYICNIELRFWNGSLSEILVHYGFVGQDMHKLGPTILLYLCEFYLSKNFN